MMNTYINGFDCKCTIRVAGCAASCGFADVGVYPRYRVRRDCRCPKPAGEAAELTKLTWTNIRMAAGSLTQ